MASPLTINIASSCGLKIDYNVNVCEYEYTIRDISKKDFKFLDDGMMFQNIWKGRISPIADITVPRYFLSTAIQHSKKFAYLYPPPGLAHHLDWASYENDNEEDRGNDNAKKRWALAQFAMLGAFVYFDDKMKVLDINALSISKADCKLNFVGPFRVNENFTNSLKKAKRNEILSLDIFREAGYYELAWVLPNESFQGQQNYICDNDHGSFIYIRDDGSADAYILHTKHTLVHTEGHFGSINEIFVSLAELTKKKLVRDNCYRQLLNINTFNVEDEKETSKRFQKYMKRKQPLINGNWENGRNIFHIACRHRDTKYIEELLDSEDSLKTLLCEKDEFQWTPLHYACRFHPKNEKLIVELLEKCPDAVLESDRCNRHPLHIACNSMASLKVIELLLRTEENMETERERKPSVLTRTKYLKRLPLHILCNRGVSSSKVIAALLTADIRQDKHILEIDGAGRIALHIALQNKLSPQSIKILLDAEGSIDDLTFDHRGMCPIHIACMRNYSQDVVKLLLEKDLDGIQLKLESTQPLSSYYQYTEEEKFINLKRGPGSHRSIRAFAYKGMRPIHLALSIGATNICELLLQEEDDKGPFRSPSLLAESECKRYPLHIACMENLEESLIRRVHCTKVANLKDSDGLTPLHYACDHEDAQISIIKMLIDAQDEETMKESNTNLLLIAVKAGASDVVLETLLQPQFCHLKDFSESLIQDLGLRVKNNVALQRRVNHKLSDRLPLSLLLYDLCVKFLSFVCFVTWSNSLVNGFGNSNYEATGYITFNLLCVSLSYLILREITAIISHRVVGYFVRYERLMQLLTICLMIYSLHHLHNQREERGEQEESTVSLDPFETYVLIFTVLFQTLIIIISLRSTFLPLAKFAGALKEIFYRLIPFFVVSIFVLVTFTFVYRMRLTVKIYTDDKPKDEDSEMINNCDSKETFLRCFYFMTHSFFHGFEKPYSRIDIAFGVFAIIILLTIVIAIVSDAWSESQDVAATIFWNGRLFFLSGIGSVDGFISRWTPKWLDTMHKTIDSTQNSRFFYKDHDISWTKESPYKEVKTFDQYKNPFHYFEPKMAEQIMAANSTSSDIYWANQQFKNKWDKFKNIARSILKRIGKALFYAILIILGSFTGGFFWPQRLRRWMLSIGIQDKKGHDEARYDDNNFVRHELKDVPLRLVQIENELKIVNSELKRVNGELARMNGTANGGLSTLNRKFRRYASSGVNNSLEHPL